LLPIMKKKSIKHSYLNKKKHRKQMPLTIYQGQFF